MDEKKFNAIMIFLVPQIIQLITENEGIDEMAATRKFYESEVYALLEQEDTKLWHFSPLTLFHMFEEERTNGVFVIPEEV